jgi:hypothetical protein
MNFSSVVYIPVVFSYKDAIVLVAAPPQSFSERAPKFSRLILCILLALNQGIYHMLEH